MEDKKPGKQFTTSYGEQDENGVDVSLIRLNLGLVGRPIINNTNLKGLYDFNLKFASQTVSTPTATNDNTPEPSGPSIFTSMTEQLGLKLDSGRGPVEVLVIDSVQKPSEN